MVKLAADAGLPNPEGSGTALSPGTLPRLGPTNQSFLAPSGHMGSDSPMAPELIGAVRLPGAISHPTCHVACVPHHMGHMHGQGSRSAMLSQSSGGAKISEGGPGSKGGYLGGSGFGFGLYGSTEVPKNVQTCSAWDNQVSLDEVHQAGHAVCTLISPNT